MVAIQKGTIPADIQSYVDSVLAQLTLDEKIRVMSGNISLIGLGIDMYIHKHYNRKPYPAGGLDRFHIPAIKFCDGPRGAVQGQSTCFPVSMARGASWDIEMEERIGRAIGREVRAHGGNYFGGVCINLLRHPAWGRAQETYGEDPYLLGEMGAALVRGVQHQNVMACAKHYAANSIENSRFKVDVHMDERTLREVYLPHFKRCVDEGAASVMGAYNKFNGDQCCESDYLLNQILKKEWGFEGFTLSDFVYGVRDAVKAVNSGMDVEMPVRTHYGKLKKAVKSRQVPMEKIDEAVRRILTTILRFSSAPDPESYGPQQIACEEHVKLAQEAAEKSMVLLKNEGDLLPLPFDLRKLAVFGELAAAANLGDRGSSQVFPPYTVTALQGLQQRLKDSAEILYADGADIQHACDLAAQADAVVVVAGCRPTDEGEFMDPKGHIGGDRRSISLRADEISLIRAVSQVNHQVCVVLIGGSAFTMEEWRREVPAILMAWYPGMQGGTALARVLCGDVNPCGKLPFTIPQSAGDLPRFDPDAEQIEYGYYHGYTLFEKKNLPVIFSFGFGLSYTHFRYGKLKVEVNSEGLQIMVEITNIGDRPGAEVIQVYTGENEPTVDRPVKLLRGFQKVSLMPQETQDVFFRLPLQSLAYYDPQSKEWRIDPGKYTLYAGGSSRSEDLRSATFTYPPETV